MSYQFTPLSEEELNKQDLIDSGIYDFEVTKSERKTSKAGNPMAAVQLKIWDKEGKVKIVFDYLVFSSVNLNIRKVKHFCDSVGLIEEYNKGDIPEELECYCGKVEIGCQEPLPNPNGGFYPAKNIVIDYIKRDKDEPKKYEMKPLPHIEDEFDNEKDLPF